MQDSGLQEPGLGTTGQNHQLQQVYESLVAAHS